METKETGSSTEVTGWRHLELIHELIDEGLVEFTTWRHEALMRTPCPSELVPGAWFDAGEVRRTCQFFLLLRQQIDRWAGNPFKLFDWQVEFLIAPVFGWRYPVAHIDPELAGTRIVRKVWFEIPRKNGKSTMCSGLGLKGLLADGQAGPQVYAAAGDKTQAGMVFGPSKEMALGSKPILRRLGGSRQVQRHLINRKGGGIYRVLSSDGGRQHGLNVSMAIIDEVHVHKTPDLIEALETGIGSRSEPLVIFITTADDGDETSIYSRKREYVEMLVGGSVQDPSFLGVVFGADQSAEGFDPFDWQTIVAANPGAGLTVTRRYLEDAAREAKAAPKELNKYLRLHLNVRTKQTTKWLPLDRWDNTGQLIAAEEWRGKVAFGGLDLSTTTDLTSFCFMARDAKGAPLARWLFWLPEERAAELEASTSVPYLKWATDKHLALTEGNVVDYEAVRAGIRAEERRLGVKLAEVGYDPWNATETVQMLERDGLVMIPIRQGYASLSPPSKELERLIIGSTPERPLLRTTVNPVMRFCIDCVEVISDVNGNIRPVKPDRYRSSKRIDGVPAALMALDRMSRHKPPKKKQAVGF